MNYIQLFVTKWAWRFAPNQVMCHDQSLRNYKLSLSLSLRQILIEMSLKRLRNLSSCLKHLVWVKCRCLGWQCIAISIPSNLQAEKPMTLSVLIRVNKSVICRNIWCWNRMWHHSRYLRKMHDLRNQGFPLMPAVWSHTSVSLFEAFCSVSGTSRRTMTSTRSIWSLSYVSVFVLDFPGASQPMYVCTPGRLSGSKPTRLCRQAGGGSRRLSFMSHHAFLNSVLFLFFNHHQSPLS